MTYVELKQLADEANYNLEAYKEHNLNWYYHESKLYITERSLTINEVVEEMLEVLTKDQLNFVINYLKDSI